jgi:hypothetical protein
LTVCPTADVSKSAAPANSQKNRSERRSVNELRLERNFMGFPDGVRYAAMRMICVAPKHLLSNDEDVKR